WGDKPQCQPLSWDRQKHRVLVPALSLSDTGDHTRPLANRLALAREVSANDGTLFFGTVHTAAHIVFDRVAGLDAPIRTQPVAATAHTMSAIGADLLRPFFAIGLVALVLMAPLAATSTVGMIRRLGGRRWQALRLGRAYARSYARRAASMASM